MKNIQCNLTFLLLCLLFCLPRSSFSQVVQEWVVHGGEALALDDLENIYVGGFCQISGFGQSNGYYYVTRKYTPDGTQVWESLYDITDIIGFWGHEVSLAVDAVGNVYLADFVSPEDDQGDYITIKYTSSGTLSWVNYYNGPGIYHDVANAIAVDSEGNVYVTGISSSEGYNMDCVTIKYSTDGALLWLSRYDSGGWDGGIAIAVDDIGYVYVTGVATGFGTQDDYATIKYTPDGTQLWVRSYNGDGDNWVDDWPAAIAADSTGNVYVTGYSEPNEEAAHGIATIKYSPDGLQLWVSRYDYGDYHLEQDFNKEAGLEVDPSGNVYVTGRNWANDTKYDYVTVKYSSDGTELWERRYNGPEDKDDKAFALAIDTDGNAYVTGKSYGTSGLHGTFNDLVTIKYAPNGTQLWLDRFDRGEGLYDSGRVIIVDSDQNVYVTGTVTIKYVQDVGIVNDENQVPSQINLSQNYPNPFNFSTTIQYDLPYQCRAEINIYNNFGQKIKTLVNEVKDAGRYSVVWNGRNDEGKQLVSGVYFCRFEAGGFFESKKLILLK